MDAKAKVREAFEAVEQRAREIEGTCKDVYHCSTRALPQVNGEFATLGPQLIAASTSAKVRELQAKLNAACERKATVLERLESLEDVGARIRNELEGCTAAALQEVESVLHLVHNFAGR